MPPATASASAAKARDLLLDLLGPAVREAGCDLEDVSVSSAGRRSLVRVIVDADGGIDLDAVALVSRVVSDLLDAEGDHLLRGAFVLEVSSPGVDRPLTEPRHWRRATGRLVTVEVGGKPVTGRVQQVTDAAVTFDVDGAGRTGSTGSTVRTVPFADLGRGRVQVEFSHAAGAEADVDDIDADDAEQGEG